MLALQAKGYLFSAAVTFADEERDLKAQQARS